MAFVKKTWTDRVAEFINRRLLTKSDGSTELVTVTRSEGTVSTEGDGFNAKNMNDLEQRIADEFSALNNAIGETKGVYGQIGVDNLTNVTAVVRMQKLSANKANIFISYRINSNEGTSSDVTLIDITKITALLGINSLTFNTWCTEVNIHETRGLDGTTLVEISPMYNADYAGHSGFMVERYENYMLFCREYANTGALGGWALNLPMYNIGLYGSISIWGADIA